MTNEKMKKPIKSIEHTKSDDEAKEADQAADDLTGDESLNESPSEYPPFFDGRKEIDPHVK